MEFRKLSEADASAWWKLRLEAVETTPLAFGQTVDEVRAMPLEEIAERVREKADGSFTLGCFSGGEMIAMASFQRESSRVKERHKGICGRYICRRRIVGGESELRWLRS